ncbi:hypothetical protein BBBOND_0103560 [Babesia bigemina]|uniref:Uncharacterized protein n=1 Tax=Babesia bigemina TaxID=5866 RepID=A0A061D1N4_BABBI|nr:hypothetical protein BBBOND_0103560 [Babesia bigemina]CDR94042.1 hypothetical protein BBBOND_0103560 [Babesia bigemina]|eukprot:XP_012766228.1 hypothetical protein BBBOND_0103560 [Babesia bigemina]
MVYNALTDIPRNLKEGIDWLLALKGTDSENNMTALGTAIHKFLVTKPVGFMQVPALENVKQISKEFMEQEEIKGLWPISELLERFTKPMDKSPAVFYSKFNVDESDYSNVVVRRGVKPEDIAKDISEVVDGCEKFLEEVKKPDQYESAYSAEATWEASCSENPEDCAAVFVGIAPMLYAGLRSLRKASNNEQLKCLRLYKTGFSLEKVLDAMGYKEADLKSNNNGSYIFKALRSVSFRMLVTLYDLSGFWAFYETDTPVPGGALSAESTLRAKAREFYMGEKKKYGIPGVDVDMGLVNAWNTKTYHNKRPKISTASATGNFQSPGAPTVANLDAASPF